MQPNTDTLTLNKAFSSALLNPEGDVPNGLTGPRGNKVDRRFAVYRNNVIIGLLDALADIFPTTQNLVGRDYFRATARLYIRAEPPSSPVIFEYGQGFADFVAVFPPARHLRYLPDVIRLERFWLDAFHAADAEPLSPATLASVSPDRLESLRFASHPALRLIRSPFACVSILARDRQGDSLQYLDPTIAEDGLITRPAQDVELRRLPPGGFVFISALRTGRSLGEAAAESLADAPDADLAALIAGMLDAGAFTAILPSGSDEEHA